MSQLSKYVWMHVIYFANYHISMDHVIDCTHFHISRNVICRFEIAVLLVRTYVSTLAGKNGLVLNVFSRFIIMVVIIWYQNKNVDIFLSFMLNNFWGRGQHPYGTFWVRFLVHFGMPRYGESPRWIEQILFHVFGLNQRAGCGVLFVLLSMARLFLFVLNYVSFFLQGSENT